MLSTFTDRQNAIWELKLTPTQKFVLFTVNKHAWYEPTCNPSIDTIARLTGYGRSTVKKALSDLKAAGLLLIKSGGGRLASSYTICIPDTRSADAPVNHEPGQQMAGRRATGGQTRPADSPPRSADGHKVVHEVAKEIVNKNNVAANVDSKEKPSKAKAKPGNGWATLTNEHIKAVCKGNDVDTFLKFDAIGRKEFGWTDSEVCQRQRLALWSYASRKGSNPAGMLTTCFNRGWLESPDDGDDEIANRLLKPAPVITETAIKLPPAEPDAESVRLHNAAGLASLAR